MSQCGPAPLRGHAAPPRLGDNGAVPVQERVRTKGQGPRDLAAVSEAGGTAETSGGGHALPRSWTVAG